MAVIGPLAEYDGIIGNWKCSGKLEETVTVYEGIKNLLKKAEVVTVAGCGITMEDTDKSGFAQAVKMATEADAVVLCLGEPMKYSGEGNSRATLGLPGVQLELAKEVIGANPNTAVLTFSGRPLELTELDKSAPAILHMWMPGTEGGNAAARLLFGESNPCGKLAMTFPKMVGQCPVYYNYTRTGRPKKGDDEVHQAFVSNYIDCGNKPLYFFGQGLSYTNFEYESMNLSRKKMKPDGKITVTVKVTNTGKREGKEVVQLYLHDLVASAVQPVQKLIAFKKISLKPGETKSVRFEITEPMLRFWNFENKFVSKPGEFEVMTGYADHMSHTEKFVLE